MKRPFDFARLRRNNWFGHADLCQKLLTLTCLNPSRRHYERSEAIHLSPHSPARKWIASPRLNPRATGNILYTTVLCLGMAHPATSHAAAFGGGFSLVNGAGKTVTAQAFHGKFVLIFFGYTHCPDLCPTTLYMIVQALQEMGAESASVQPLFITIDPARDTPSVIGQYVALFSPRIIGLSGKPAELDRIEQEYHVYVGPADPKTGDIVHSSMLYITAPDGKFLTALSGTLTPLRLADRLRQVIASDKQ